MRKQIAAANWKMNLTLQQGEKLVEELLANQYELNENRLVVFGVPFPYLATVQMRIGNREHIHVAAQNCYTKKEWRLYRGNQRRDAVKYWHQSCHHRA